MIKIRKSVIITNGLEAKTNTHKKVVKGAELPCKTPDGMFDEDYIPNDLGYVLKKVNEYYG